MKRTASTLIQSSLAAFLSCELQDYLQLIHSGIHFTFESKRMIHGGNSWKSREEPSSRSA